MLEWAGRRCAGGPGARPDRRETRHQGLAILGRAFHGLLAFHALFLGEDIHGRRDGGPGFGLPDVAQVGFDRRLDGSGDIVRHVRRLVDPAAPMPRAGEDLFESLPEPERTVSNRDLGCDREAPSLDSTSSARPVARQGFARKPREGTLRALAHADLEADEFLAAFRYRADDHRHALGLRLHPRLQTDAIRPDAGVSAGGGDRGAANARRPLPIRRSGARARPATGSGRPAQAGPRGSAHSLEPVAFGSLTRWRSGASPWTSPSRCVAGTGPEAAHRGCATAAPTLAEWRR